MDRWSEYLWVVPMVVLMALLTVALWESLSEMTKVDSMADSTVLLLDYNLVVTMDHDLVA